MPETGDQHPDTGPFSAVDQPRWGDARYPLGAHYDGDDVTFAVYSRRASRILLEVYSRETGEDARHDYWLTKNAADDIWRGKVADVPAGALYAFRCWGTNWDYDPGWQRGGSGAGFVADVDGAGNRFNPNKVLHDPYARELSHDMSSDALGNAGESAALFATGGESYNGVPRREVDTGPWAPKAIVIADTTSTGQKPRIPPENAIIYEVHTRGLTRHPSVTRLETLLRGEPGFENVTNVPDRLRGTYAGAAHMAEYVRGLGFTTIELLPVHETNNDDNPDDAPGGNYWGYMTFGYFAPDRRYAADKSPGGPTREFKDMVRAFHEAGIEVYLDVVYNHSGEGGNWNGDLLTTAFTSLGGFDAVEYYVLTDENYLVQGATGTGNQINYSNAAPQQLVLDSLRYWMDEMGVDGFRFDLAPVLGRTPNAFERENWDAQRQFFPTHPLLVAIRDMGRANNVEMIAEAWDIWGYEVGNFPADWGEWNGRYRDAVRRFLKGDGNTGDFVSRVNGDYNNFNDQGGPQRSINFITAHDGFTLMDLVSYNAKNNSVTWPFGPSDGGNDSNDSWDSDGDQALRRQRLRNFWTIMIFSRGVPMAVWGDEFGRTQNGNNNAYNIDSVATWSNYGMVATHAPNAIETGGGGAYHDNFGTADCAEDRNPLFVFVTNLLRLRRESRALQQRRYADLVMDSGGDVTYSFKREDGISDLYDSNRCVWLRIDGSEVGETDFLLLCNMYSEDMEFAIPQAANGRRWVRIIDTAGWAEPSFNCWVQDQAGEIRDSYEVESFSCVVLREVP
ncbi:MAG: glycogen-debranching protein [Hyphomicrobiales bacterium]|nr:glycogen-debranching protein [Hyphomicrobiales bacterium]